MVVAGSRSGAEMASPGWFQRRGPSGATVGERWSRWFPTVDLAPSDDEPLQGPRTHKAPEIVQIVDLRDV